MTQKNNPYMSKRTLVNLRRRSCSLLFRFTLSLFCEHGIAFHWPNALHFTSHAFICAALLSVKSCYFPWGNMNQTQPLWVSTGWGIPFSHPFAVNSLKSHSLFDTRTIQLNCAILNYRNTFQLQDEDLDVTQFPARRVTLQCSLVHTWGIFFYGICDSYTD